LKVVEAVCSEVVEMRCALKPALSALLLLISVLELNEPAEGIPFNAIVPNLSTGWFHKPGPTESIVFGLIVLKVCMHAINREVEISVFPLRCNSQSRKLLGGLMHMYIYR
jgi:hypothetical protein